MQLLFSFSGLHTNPNSIINRCSWKVKAGCGSGGARCSDRNGSSWAQTGFQAIAHQTFFFERLWAAEEYLLITDPLHNPLLSQVRFLEQFFEDILMKIENYFLHGLLHLHGIWMLTVF